MKKLLILLLLTLLWKSASAQFAVFDGANAVNMGVEIGHSVTQIQKAADMLKRFQQVSTAVSRCNRMRKSLTKALQDLNDCRNMANSVALDKTSARALGSQHTDQPLHLDDDISHLQRKILPG